MAIMSFGGVPNADALRMRVYYEGTNTIYEGMPVCYNWDTTDNWLDVDKADYAAEVDSDTAEGYQNEGKVIRVEDPASANLFWLAGFVADCSPNLGVAGPGVVDIYVAKEGSIIKVRTDQSCTVGRTVLSIANATQELTSSGRPVAVAMETVDRSSTSGIVMAKICPELFTYQYNGSTTLNLPATAASRALNLIDITSNHTGGYSSAVVIKNTFGGALAATGGGAALIGYLKTGAAVTATTGYIRSILGQLDHTGGTLNGSNLHVCAVMAQVNGNGTLTAVSKMASLMCDMSISGSGPVAGDLSFIRCANNNSQNADVKYVFDIYGGYGITNLFNFDGCANVAEDTSKMVFAGSGTGALSIGTSWKKVRVVVDGTEYFIVLCDAPTVA